MGSNIRPVINGMFRQAEQVVESELAGATLADCMARMRERIESNEKSGKSTMRQEGKGR